MDAQPVHYGGRLAAIACRDRFLLIDELASRDVEDPERTFVIFMCAYAGDVLNGRLPGPYSELDARIYARCCLISLGREICGGRPPRTGRRGGGPTVRRGPRT